MATDKETSTKIASLAAKGLRGETLTTAEIKEVCGSALVQHEKGHHSSQAEIDAAKAKHAKKS